VPGHDDSVKFKAALDAPPGLLRLIDEAVIDRAVDASRRSPRRRVILPFHASHGDPLQRMLNVLQPGSYIRPHRHLDPPKSEGIVVLRGAIRFVAFDGAGAITTALRIEATTGACGIDIDPGVFHTFYALREDTVLYEVKPGPYEELSDKDFAGWAPVEWSGEAAGWLRELERRAAAHSND
jgi:cupin fold WbuC family metalloprotein